MKRILIYCEKLCWEFTVFSLRSRSFSLVGQNDDIKDCINQGLSERDSSPRLAESGYRGMATSWFVEEEWQNEEEAQPELTSCERDTSSGHGSLGRICRWRREMTQKNNSQTIWHRGSYTSSLSRVSSIAANHENTLNYTIAIFENISSDNFMCDSEMWSS